MPDDIWHSWLCVYFRNRALPTQEAHDCAHEAFLRYTQHAEAPAWNDGNPPALLWQIAHDVLCEYCRQRDRHARLQQRLIQHQRCAPPCDVEEMAIDAVECERFMASLPGRLREVLQLRLQGYTYADIAQALTLSQGTVKSYGAQLREKFRKYFGYDPTKSPSRIGNIHGGLSEEALPLSEKEEVDDAQGTGMDSGGAVRGKRVRSAPHARRARTVRGGGTAPVPLTLMNSGCGCGGVGDSSLSSPILSSVTADRAFNGVQTFLCETGGVRPLAAGCVDLEDDCIFRGSIIQYRCVNEWWMPTCFGQFEQYERWRYRWQCGNCYIVRCCDWSRSGCCDQLANPPCQDNDPPCSSRPCAEPQINCD